MTTGPSTPLDLDIALTLQRKGEKQIKVESFNNDVRVTFSTLTAAFTYAKQAKGLSTNQVVMQRIQQLLMMTDVSISINVSQYKIAYFDCHSSGSLISRFLGVGPIKIRFGNVLKAIFSGK